MLRRIGFRVQVVCLALALGGCAGGYKSLRQDVRRIDKNVSDLRNFQAEQTSEIAALQTELRNLVGRVEELEYLQRARLGSDISQLKNNLSSLQQKEPPAIVPMPTLEADEQLARRLPRVEVGTSFADALAKIRQGAFSEALPLLQRAYEKNFGEEGTVEIVFWRGVAYEGLGENRRALEAYGQMITDFPEHPRKALALLRQGSVFIRLGDFRTAELSFRKLIGEYPRSPEASQAKQRLKDL